MQVMTSVHPDKSESFGGRHAAFDPVTNLRVGVKVLKECIARAGSIEGGLRHYVGAANLESDGGYAAKVLAEHQRLRLAVGLRAEPILTASVKPKDAAPVAGASHSDAADKPAGISAKTAAVNTPSPVTRLSQATDQVALAEPSI